MIHWTAGLSLELVEQMCIEQAYKFYQGNKTATSNALGIAIRTLDAKLEKYQNDGRSKQSRVEEGLSAQQDFIRRSRASAPQFALQGSIPIAEARIRMEPVAQIANQSQVPVPERKEVQEALQRPTTQGSPSRKR